MKRRLYRKWKRLELRRQLLLAAVLSSRRKWLALRRKTFQILKRPESAGMGLTLLDVILRSDRVNDQLTIAANEIRALRRKEQSDDPR